MKRLTVENPKENFETILNDDSVDSFTGSPWHYGEWALVDSRNTRCNSVCGYREFRPYGKTGPPTAANRSRLLLPALAFLLLLILLLEPPPALPEPLPQEPAPVVRIIPPPAEPEEAAPSGPPPGAHIIENCTVTWYTEDTCGKAPNHPAYGITASGLPVEEGITCAVDPAVIPLFSEVYVQYADGTVSRFQATDTGVTGDWVDIYTPDYDYAAQSGLQTLTVYWTAPEEEIA